MGRDQRGPRGVLRDHQARVSSLAFNATGDLLLSGAQDGSGRLWDPWERRQLLAFPTASAPSGWSGQSLASKSGTRLQQWEIAPGREHRTLHSASIRPDGRWLAVGCQQDGLHVWDLPLGRKVAHLCVGPIRGVAFHPDGRHVFTAGVDGLFRWPFRADAEAMHVGPPDTLPVPPNRPGCFSS